ncbi:Quinoprotein glucose dehydrogenase (PQQ, quinone) [Flagellimonas maritima]|uniref:Quinoprotein glucose dehydrogenase (PQQ, quinone) n=1 Tax=Flagellimonas maritima TaxID=1383885 RepID=A0A2Z4LRZ2_9FLAO|nr:PQQ-dependent sugar dehydrogenase [Allomuricauda aurantiaca]AWX44671.1 Quinoprotein glucose dehydrogenase (PQQ, quinone) [Allomuricauda aurantiaca]
MKTYTLISILILATFGCKERTIADEKNYPTIPVKEVVLDSLNHPWSIAFISNVEALISEKDGDLLRVNLESKEKQIIKGFPTDLTDSIRAIHFGDNSGIFDVLVDPDFKNNQWVYVSYTAKKAFGTTTKVIRAQLKNDALTNHQTLIEAAPFTREYYHYGGGMTFGTDKKLYVTIGERLFWERDEPEIPIAQNVTDKRGKIYRINPNGSIPKDNPDFGPDAVLGLYAMGIRAAQGITVEPRTGKIWFSEHGTIQGDEINILEAGANYGWPNVTSGKLRSKDYKPPTIEGVAFTPPAWFWSHTVAPTGLTFYTGNEFSEWKNNLIVPGLSRGSLWRFRIENETIESAEELFIHDRVRSRKVMQGPDGKLYMLTDEDDGKLIRIQPKIYSKTQ